MRLRPLDVGGGGPAVHQRRARRAGRGSGRPRAASRSSRARPRARARAATSIRRRAAGEGPHLADQLHVAVLLGVADRSPSRSSTSSPQSEPTSWSPPMPMCRWIRQSGSTSSWSQERPVPGERVVVVRVDERAVDVEDRGGRAHLGLVPDLAANARCTVASVQADEAGARRLLGLELPALAGARLSEGPAGAALARALRDALRHRRGQHHLLPAALPRRGRGLGRADARPTSSSRSRPAAT